MRDSESQPVRLESVLKEALEQVGAPIDCALFLTLTHSPSSDLELQLPSSLGTFRSTKYGPTDGGSTSSSELPIAASALGNVDVDVEFGVRARWGGAARVYRGDRVCGESIYLQTIPVPRV